MIIETKNLKLLLAKGISANGECYVLLDDVVKALEQAEQIAVRCKDCVLHGNCVAEDTFNFAKIENPFCCAGKKKGGCNDKI